jgi:NADH:flavin oxidoreductase / NADH oxidase family
MCPPLWAVRARLKGTEDITPRICSTVIEKGHDSSQVVAYISIVGHFGLDDSEAVEESSLFFAHPVCQTSTDFVSSRLLFWFAHVFHLAVFNRFLVLHFSALARPADHDEFETVPAAQSRQCHSQASRRNGTVDSVSRRYSSTTPVYFHEPLTDSPSPDDDHVQLPFVKEYYAQRASVPGTLLVTEATFISPQASGYANVPGIYTPEMVAAWKEVTAAVHQRGSIIFCQLWCLGRAATAKVLAAKGLDVVSASDIPISARSAVPRPLTEDEIQQLIRDYANAATAAIEAGFDGVEIHGANG